MSPGEIHRRCFELFVMRHCAMRRPTDFLRTRRRHLPAIAQVYEGPSLGGKVRDTVSGTSGPRGGTRPSLRSPVNHFGQEAGAR